MNSLIQNVLSKTLTSSLLMARRQISVSAPLSIKKHWNQKYRKQRGQKVFKIKLPNMEEKRRIEFMSDEEAKDFMKRNKISPSRPWDERPIFTSCTTGVIDPYVPPEGDGKYTIITKDGSKQKLSWGKHKFTSHRALSKIREFEEEFDVPDFLTLHAQPTYIEAHKALADYDEDKLHDLVTDHCYAELCLQTKLKTLRWEFIKSLERPKIVNIATGPKNMEDTFIQITVRFHTQQKLAVYNRFGHLLYGNEDLVKDVLEFVVFEKQVSNQYGRWRIHEKIVPDWMPGKPDVALTFATPLAQ